MSDKIDKVVRAACAWVESCSPEYRFTSLAHVGPLADLILAVEAAHLEPSEPIFCLRVADRAAAPAVYFWAARAEQLGAAPDTTNRVLKLHDDIVTWQNDPANSLAVKVPT